MGTFGAPISTGAAAISSDAPENELPQQDTAAIDINDPQLTSESLTDDSSKDAFASPPPPPDGKWRAKLRLGKIKDKRDGQEKDFFATQYPNMNNGKAFFVANVEARLADLAGTFDGVTLTQYWVKSYIDPRKRTSEMSTIATKAGATMPASSTERGRLGVFVKALAGEPDVIVETQWEASCQPCGDKAKAKGDKQPRPFVYGMHRFPQVRGMADPMVKCPSCGGMSRAQVRIVGFQSLAEAKATRGLA